MPITNIQRDEGPEAAILAFADACAPIWPLVTGMVLTRTKRPQKEIFRCDVLHVTGKDEVNIDTTRTDVRQVVRVAQADAEKNGPATYKLAVWGHRTMPNKRRQVIAAPEELATQVFQFGDAEDPATSEAKGIAELLHQAGGLIKASAQATHDQAVTANTLAEGYGKLIGVQQQIIVGQAAVVAQSRDEERANSAVMLEMKRLEFDFQKTMAEWKREDAHIEAVQNSEDRRAADHNATMRKIVDDLKGPIFDIIRMELLKRGMKPSGPDPRGPGSDSSSPGEPTADRKLGPRLAHILASLDESERTKLNAVFGDRVWELVVGASQKTADDEVRVLFKLIEAELRGDPREAQGDPRFAGSKAAAEALRDRALKSLPDIIGVDRMKALFDILIDGGIDLI